jgi:hypothetical protein
VEWHAFGSVMAKVGGESAKVMLKYVYAVAKLCWQNFTGMRLRESVAASSKSSGSFRSN